MVFPRFAIGAIPYSYQESLTFLEQLECICKKINDIIDYLAQFSEENIEELINQKIDEVKIDLQNYIDTQDEKLYNYINSKINEINLQLLNEINQKIEFLTNYVNGQDTLLKNYIDEQILELKNEIDDIILKGINVYDPTSGKYNNIQDVVYNLYKYLRYYGIKAINFDSLGLTCSDFESKELTARDFDLYSKCKLENDFLHNMYSPFTGEITSIQNVVNSLANLHKNILTAQEFDDLDLTAQEFDDKNITAYDFDWNGKALLVS